MSNHESLLLYLIVAYIMLKESSLCKVAMRQLFCVAMPAQNALLITKLLLLFF
jgi:hypothetical protein